MYPRTVVPVRAAEAQPGTEQDDDEERDERTSARLWNVTWNSESASLLACCSRKLADPGAQHGGPAPSVRFGRAVGLGQLFSIERAHSRSLNTLFRG